MNVVLKEPAEPDVLAELFGISAETRARQVGAVAAPVVGPANTKLAEVEVRPVPPFATGKVPDTSVVSETADQDGVVPPCKTWLTDPVAKRVPVPDAPP